VASSADDKIRVLARVAIATAAGGAAAAWIPASGWPERALDGWAVGAGLYVVLTWLYVFLLSPRQVKAHGEGIGTPHRLIGFAVVWCAILSLFAVGEITRANTQTGSAALRDTVTGLLGVVVSWAAVHTVYMVRYADLYFTDGARGIDFPGEKHEKRRNRSGDLTYTDFAYVAFTIGMAYAVSDTSLTSHKMRKTALRHSVVSYVFGAVILAATVNLIAGLDFWHTK